MQTSGSEFLASSSFVFSGADGLSSFEADLSSPSSFDSIFFLSFDKVVISSVSISPRLSLTSSLMRFCVSASVGRGQKSSEALTSDVASADPNGVAEGGGGAGCSPSSFPLDSPSAMGCAVTISSSDLGAEWL